AVRVSCCANFACLDRARNAKRLFPIQQKRAAELRGCACLLARRRGTSRADRPAPGRILYLELAELFGALEASRWNGCDGTLSAMGVRGWPDVRNAVSSYALAGSDSRPPRPAGGRVFPVCPEAKASYGRR